MNLNKIKLLNFCGDHVEKIVELDQSFCNPLKISEEMIANVIGDDKVGDKGSVS